MQKIISTEKIPIKLWLDDIEDGALQQTIHLANLPFAFKHIAIMPDCHQGYGMPIGGVMATKDVIIPNAVGVDIGCGMCAVQTNIESIKRKELEKVVNRIRELIPVGFNWHKKPMKNAVMPERKYAKDMPVVNQEYEHACHQIGTLGGGNHFIEIQHGSDGRIWLMVHSGSRNIGKQVADFYNKLAQSFNKRHELKVPKEWQLAFLPMDSNEAGQYRNEMEYCVEFALANREAMIQNIKKAFQDLLGVGFDDYGAFFNIAHNFATMETHFNENVIVHRKGATQAVKGQIGIIPGSQGTKSYIVKGKGNKESFESCSHGSGRRMGRKQAMRELDLKKEKEYLEKKGIIHSIKRIKDLDEAPGAYKNINVVMKNQQDLVDIMVELSPLAVIKG